MLIADSIDEIYPLLIKDILDNGKTVESRVAGAKELTHQSFIINDASRCIILNPARKLHYAYAVVEMFGLFARGRYVQEMLMAYCPPLVKIEMNPDTGLFDGHYGERLLDYNQFAYVLDELHANPNSRRAVMTMYNPVRDMRSHASKDVCCTLALQFRINDGKLDMYAMMRSNDVFLGLPYDLTQFTFLQSLAANFLGVQIGAYHHYTTSLHAYENDFPKLLGLIAQPFNIADIPSLKYAADWQAMPTFDDMRSSRSHNAESYVHWIKESVNDIIKFDMWYRASGCPAFNPPDIQEKLNLVPLSFLYKYIDISLNYLHSKYSNNMLFNSLTPREIKAVRKSGNPYAALQIQEQKSNAMESKKVNEKAK